MPPSLSFMKRTKNNIPPHSEKDGQRVSPFHDVPLHADAKKGIFNMIVEIPQKTRSVTHSALKMTIQLIDFSFSIFTSYLLTVLFNAGPSSRSPRRTLSIPSSRTSRFYFSLFMLSVSVGPRVDVVWSLCARRTASFALSNMVMGTCGTTVPSRRCVKCQPLPCTYPPVILP